MWVDERVTYVDIFLTAAASSAAPGANAVIGKCVGVTVFLRL